MASKDQRRGHQAIEGRVHQTHAPSQMYSQCYAYTQERMCVSFRDLNNACPKDDFPLPHIDVLVDDTVVNALMSFMDGFSGYKQIKMAPKVMTKTTFTTEWGIYCYTMIPFGLKNAGATYQRLATALLHDMMHNEVEVYVNDMIVKSKERGSHH